MKKILLSLMGVALPATMVLSGGATLASDTSRSNNGLCSGSLVINVTQKVRNDADSGTAGNTWANDNYSRQIKVWQTAPNTFCAVTNYDGQFTTYAGKSPQNSTTSGTVGAGVKGNFDGGYTATFTGTLNPSPAYSAHGNIGTFNYACTPANPEPGDPTCPGYVDWTAVYFTGGVSNFNENPWGWQYDTCNNGSWVNASTGNSGDITGNVQHHTKDQCHDKDHHDNDNREHQGNDRDEHHERH